MELLEYLKLAAEYEKKPASQGDVFRVAIVTNFTDDLLQKIVTGMCVAEGIAPRTYRVPFKQYLFELKDPQSSLVKFAADITFVFFDANPYLNSEFSSEKHWREVLDDLKGYATVQQGLLVVHTLAHPATLQHSRLLRGHALRYAAGAFSKALEDWAADSANVRIIDTSALLHRIGEQRARDLRGLYAFSQPFTHEFLFAVAREWMSHIRTQTGKTKKCIVVDLDNTLWGGIVGEVGPNNIALGHEYPGNAFVAFQKVLLEMYEHGIILAINSRNNAADVDEVFEKNPHMALGKSHFASMITNWESKADNLRVIADDLNIGLDSMVFIDDDPANRALVRAQLPEVLVPEWSMPPEEYASALLNLDVFHSGELTAEDKERGRMYAQERHRKSLQATQTLEEFIVSLKVEVEMHVNDAALVPRVAQLTQKTNQYNLTTERMNEHEVEDYIAKGGLVFAGAVKDMFGPYGMTVVAIVEPKANNSAQLSNFLMSCRVMGRGVERLFFEEVAAYLREKGFTKLSARFIPTPKNTPARGVLPGWGASLIREKGGTQYYEITL